MNSSGGKGSYSEELHKIYYWHPDHLGSAQLITDWQGNEYQLIEYTPYGETWVEKTEATYEWLPYRFTGKELDSETGLYYYGARYLDPQTSVWLSTDPALGDYMPTAGADNTGLPGKGGLFNTTNCHLYHYAGNNPVRYVDPDGREFFPNLLKILSGTVKATVGGCGVVVFGSATIVLVADDCTGVGVLDDGLAALTAVGFLASCDYAFYGTQEIASGVFGIGCDISTAIQRKLSGFTF